MSSRSENKYTVKVWKLTLPKFQVPDFSYLITKNYINKIIQYDICFGLNQSIKYYVLEKLSRIVQKY